MFTGDTFPHVGTRDHYYIREKTVNDATNTDNTNIDCDDEAFENMPNSLPLYGGCHRQHTLSLCQNNVWREMDVSYHTSICSGTTSIGKGSDIVVP